MKLIAMLGAGALAIGTFAAVPADAQRWDGHRGYHGWHDRGDYRDYRGGYYRHHGYRGYGRVVCRVHRGYYGRPIRTCFRG